MRGGGGPRQPGGGQRQAGPRHRGGASAKGKSGHKASGHRRTADGATAPGAPGRASRKGAFEKGAFGPRPSAQGPSGEGAAAKIAARKRTKSAGAKGAGAKGAGTKGGTGRDRIRRGQRGDRSDTAGAWSPRGGPRPSTPDRAALAEAPSRRPSAATPAATSAITSAVLPTKVETVTVTADEAGLRVDRFLEARCPGLSFSHIQRVIRKGEVRVNGKRTDAKDRLEAGQAVRIPPLKLAPPRAVAQADDPTRAFLASITLFEDDDVLVFNKPYGLAVQGGSGTTRHVDGMLDVLRDAKGQRPRLVHRLDKDTSGCLLVAKTRFAASALARSFRSREARKVYWALVAGVPKPRQGRISTYLAKEEVEADSYMRVARHGEEGASHAVTYYAVVETAAQTLAWLSMKPVTGRTHQLRAHAAHIGHPIVGDPKYFNKENWQLPGGLQNRLHLLARRLRLPHPRGGMIDVSAPLPAHMAQTWNLLGFDASRYDPIEEAPEE